MKRLTRSKIKAAPNSAVGKRAKSKKCSETEEGSNSKKQSQPQSKIMCRDDSDDSETEEELPKMVTYRNRSLWLGSAPKSSSVKQFKSGQISNEWISSTNHYNAMVIGILNEDDAYYGISRVIARMSVSNKTKLPSNWMIRYGNKEARAGSLAAMDLLRMSSPSKPVQLFVKIPTPRKFKINVEVTIPPETVYRRKTSRKEEVSSEESTSKVVVLEVTGEDTLEKIEKDVYSKIKMSDLAEDEYYFKYNQIKLKETDKKLKGYGIRANAELKLMFTKYTSDIRRRGYAGGCPDAPINFRTVDVEAQQLNYKALQSTDSFRCFEDGMNFTGKCPRVECISNRKKARGMMMDVVVCRVGFGVVNLTPQNNKVKCPACKEGEFTPTNFLVSRGRALFRFKKSGPGKEVDQVLLEHVFYHANSGFDYSMFDETEGRSSNYYYIEIKTVKWNESPYSCVECGNDIDFWVEEYFPQGCGHAYHQVCRPPGQNCQVCEAPEWTEAEASSHNESLSSANGLDSNEEEAGTSQ